MKKCTRCKKNRKLANFAKKRNGLSTICKACHRVWCKIHYKKNKHYYYNKKKRYRETIYSKLKAYKESHPCKDCQLFYPACVLDFDHIGKDKRFNIGSAAYNGEKSWDAIQVEMAKCELVCANCHRVRTYNRKRNL